MIRVSLSLLVTICLLLMLGTIFAGASGGGTAPGGLEGWPTRVNGVLSAQLANLKARAEAAD